MLPLGKHVRNESGVGLTFSFRVKNGFLRIISEQQSLTVVKLLMPTPSLSRFLIQQGGFEVSEICMRQPSC